MTAGEEVGCRVLSPVWGREEHLQLDLPFPSCISCLELSLVGCLGWGVNSREERVMRSELNSLGNKP